MELYRFFPKPSDRMGLLWTLASIEGAYIIEFGPAGTTHFSLEGMMQLDAEHKASAYTTHIDETDIAFGSTERLEKAIIEVDKIHNPKVIFIMASSISSIIGTDIESVVFEMESEVRAKLIPITTGGFKGDYSKGIEEGLSILAERIVKESTSTDKRTFNIIGNNIDTYNFLSEGEEVKRMMEEAFGYKCNSIFTAYSDLEEIEKASEAEINIVIRSEGIKCAEILKERFRQEYLLVRPYGVESTLEALGEISELISCEIDKKYLKEIQAQGRNMLMQLGFISRELTNRNVLISGDYDTAVGMARFVHEIGLNVEKLIINHSIKRKLKKSLLEIWGEDVIIDPTEIEKEKILKSKEYHLIMGDGNTLEMGDAAQKLLISSPNFKTKKFYKYTPFIGFNGFINLTEKLVNLHLENVYSE